MKITKAAKLHLAAIAATGLMAASSQAIIIDDFTNGQSVIDTSNNPSTETKDVTSTGLSGILGGQREVVVQSTGGTMGFSTSQVQIGGGQLGFYNSSNLSGHATLIYDGSDGTGPTPDVVGTIDYDGLGAYNLGQTGDFFKLSLTVIDGSANFRISVYKNATDFSYYELSSALTALAPGGTTYEFLIPFTDFSTGAGGSGALTGGKFNPVGAVTLDLFGTAIGTDVTLAVVTAPAPEPTTAIAGIGLLGVIGSTFFRRNRKMSLELQAIA